MDMFEIVKQMRAVAYALDKVEVKGRENLDVILGSIQALERGANILENELRKLTATPKPAEPEVTLEVVPEEEAPAE